MSASVRLATRQMQKLSIPMRGNEFFSISASVAVSQVIDPHEG